MFSVFFIFTMSPQQPDKNSMQRYLRVHSAILLGKVKHSITLLH